MKAPILACIFDLDGVIVDTAKYHFLAWQRLAREMDISFTEADNEQLKGVSRVESLRIILEMGQIQLEEAQFEAKMAQKNEWFLEYIYQMSPDEVLPGVQAFLDELKAHHIRIALGSASKNALTILNQIKMRDYFEVIVDGNLITAAKPNPQVFLKAAEGLGIAPENCVVFEDAEKGVEAAHRGQMRAIGVGAPEILGEAELVIPGFAHFSLSDLNPLTH
ncbi:MAG: beta-phosphoglucomutase [Microscillaceae bacterium]|nr:beta-phosphoglucomutase [Microscillaceae bacterium]